MNHVRYDFPDGETLTVPDTDAVPAKGERVEILQREGVWEVEARRVELTLYPSTAIQTTVVELGPA